MTTNPTPNAIFMMGGTGSGKTFVRLAQYPDLRVIDCDTFKAHHPEYDPKAPEALHAWSSAEATKAVFAAIGAGETFVFDGTGTDAEKYVRFILAAQQAGYRTTVVYVTTDLQTALARNAARERTVPEAIVRQKHATVGIAFEIVSRYADDVKVVRN